MKNLPPELLAQLAAIMASHEFGKTNVLLSQSNREMTKAEIVTSIPERFNHDNSAAQGHIARKLRGYVTDKHTGNITLELKFKDGDLLVVTETRTW